MMPASAPSPIPSRSDRPAPGRRLLTLVWILAAAAVVLMGAANCVLAFGFPLELEAREGTSWLHVIAMTAHVPIYDHTRVAFMNMNHGPLDPVLKYAVHRVLPFLPAAMVTRLFVLLFPLGLFFALERALEGRRLAALLVAGGLYLFLLGLTPFHVLIGRSDPAALFFFALMLAALDYSSKSRRRGAGLDLLAGALGSAVALCNWRYLPFVLAGGGAWILERAWLREEGGHRVRYFWRVLGCFVLGLIVPFLLVFFAVFHGDLSTYYTHFFGYFIEDPDGVHWQWLLGGKFLLPPMALLPGRWIVHLLMLGALAALAWKSRGRERQLQLWLWFPALLVIWVSTAHVYDVNRDAGGLYYFAPFYVLLTFHLARFLRWEGRGETVWRLALPLLLLAGMPWPQAWKQARLMNEAMAPAREFLRDVHRTIAGATVRSEDLYFFESRYNGELIDMGDTIERELKSGIFGARFDDTVLRYYADLAAHPPQFIYMGSGVRVVSPSFDAFAAKYYTQILAAPEHLWSTGGGGAILMQRNAVPVVPFQPGL
jgi:hypothetical protein